MATHKASGDGGESTREWLLVPQVQYAVRQLGYDVDYSEEAAAAAQFLSDFTKRWGPPQTANMVAIADRFAPPQREAGNVNKKASDHNQALAIATDEELDTLFALAVLGTTQSDADGAPLLPYVSSLHPRERWLAVLGLVRQHDDRVLPALERGLLEYLGPSLPRQPGGRTIPIVKDWHWLLPWLLGEWGNPHSVPLLRSALVATVLEEKTEVIQPAGPPYEHTYHGTLYRGQEAWHAYYDAQRPWIDDEHRIVYALGQLGAFGALTGVPIRPGMYCFDYPDRIFPIGGQAIHDMDSEPEKEFRSRIWRVHTCLGFLERDFRGHMEEIVLGWEDAPELAAAVERLLVERFGLAQAERRSMMDEYETAGFISRTIHDYEVAEQNIRLGAREFP